ncbi:MAG: helix-turn-helix domain-containing protein [Flavobacteriales bacterium]|nr:helix-turn-helix domain-containing protein [Flavobacteriales bacterium]
MSSNMRIDKVCSYCGSHFVAKTTVTRHCGDSCAKKAYKLRARMKKISETEIETEIIVRRERVKKSEEISDREILSIKQAAEYIGVSISSINRGMKSGEIPYTKMLGRVFILKRKIDEKLGL